MASKDANDTVIRKGFLHAVIKFNHDVPPRQSEADVHAFCHAFSDNAIRDFRFARTTDGMDQSIDAVVEISDDFVREFLLIFRQRVAKGQTDVLGGEFLVFRFLATKGNALPAIGLPISDPKESRVLISASWTNKSSHIN
jgi:hypothetical protein